jgi:hypothetical protein
MVERKKTGLAKARKRVRFERYDMLKPDEFLAVHMGQAVVSCLLLCSYALHFTNINNLLHLLR